MADRPCAPWDLQCPWCVYKIVVNARGASRGDPGSGVEAALLMKAHLDEEHGRTWGEFLHKSIDRLNRLDDGH
jgi:hypothetical protein